MLEKKIIFTISKNVGEFIAKTFDLKKQKTFSGIQIFIGEQKNTQIILCISSDNKQDITSNLTYINDNFEFSKLFVVGEIFNANNFDYKKGDILLPNAFFSGKGDKPIFLTGSSDGNYDVGDFGMIFNGICFSVLDGNDGKDEVGADFFDIESYLILSFFLGIGGVDEEGRFFVIKSFGVGEYKNLGGVLDMLL